MKTPIYTGIFQSDLDATGFKLINLPTPSASGDAANKAYVDAHAGGGGGGSGLPQGWVSIMDHGGVADGVTDNTAAAIATIAAATSVAYFPPGNYFFAGSIGVVPANISLMGGPFLGPHGNVTTTSSLYLPNNNLSPTAGGTCFLLTANAGSTALANSFIQLSDNSSVTGITFYWPNQLKTLVTPILYPWAVYLGTGAASSVKYCNFVNGYQCIYIENTMFSLVEEVRGQALFRGIRCEGNFDVTRLRGVHFNASWSTTDAAGAYTLANAIAFDFGRNDLVVAENCFAFSYKCWVHFYNDPTHGGTGRCWGQIRGGGGDQCAVPVWVEYAQDQGIDLDGVHVSSGTGYAPAPNILFKIDSTNSGGVRIHNSMGWADSGTFGTVAGSGEVTVEDSYFLGTFTGGTTPGVFGSTGWAVTGTGNFAMRGCTFKTTQTHVSLGSSLTRAVVMGNMCSDTFNVTNNMGAGLAVIDGNTGQGTVYVGSDFRLVAVAGGAKVQARNTGTGVWVDADQWTNP